MFIDHSYFSLALDLSWSPILPLALSDQLNLTVCFNVPQSLKEETVQNSTDFQFCRKALWGAPLPLPTGKSEPVFTPLPLGSFSGLTKQQEVEEINSQGQEMLKKKRKRHRSSRRENELHGGWARSCCLVAPGEKDGLLSFCRKAGPQRQLLPPF